VDTDAMFYRCRPVNLELMIVAYSNY